MAGPVIAGWWLIAGLGLQSTTLAQQAPPANPTDNPTYQPPDDPQGNQPIVSDQQFQQELPPLSNDINAPLEPMPSTQSAAQPPAANAATSPVTMDAQTLNPPQTEDPQLAQPLVPLNQFDATPPAQVAEGKAGDTVEIRYDTELKGLDAIGLADEFKKLSALKDGKGKAANATQVQARAKEDEALAVRLMKSLGYYDGTAVSMIDQRQGQPLLATVSATPGPLYKLGTINVQADQTVPPDLVRDQLPLKVGDAIDAARIQGAEANVALVLPQRGYPFVKVGDRDILLDDATHLGDYTLPVDTGPRSSFGTYSTTGKLAFSAQHVGVLARFKQGELYDNRKVDDLRQALVATSLFSTVSVEPVRTGKPGPDGTEQVDLLVHQEAGPSKTLAGTAGYSTGEGIKAEATYTMRNVFPPEGALILGLIGGTQEQGANVTFRRSNAGPRDRTVQLGASIDHSNYDAFDARTISIIGRISRDSTPIWQKPFTYSYGFELTGTNESVYNFSRGEKTRGTYFIAALPGQALFDKSDSLLNPTKGYRLKLNLSPEASVKGAVSPYARTMVEATGYFPLGQSFVLAGRVRAGVIAGIARNDLAPSRRYYGGGGGSVRGYGYQELGPRDPNGDPVGGRSLNEFSVEARYRFGNFGIVPFFDGGQAYESVLPKGSDLHYGAGIGGRFYTNFGPLRVDLATPLNPRKGDPKIALYISIGQAF